MAEDPKERVKERGLYGSRRGDGSQVMEGCRSKSLAIPQTDGGDDSGGVGVQYTLACARSDLGQSRGFENMSNSAEPNNSGATARGSIEGLAWA